MELNDANATHALDMKGIEKEFNGNYVLRQVDFSVSPGEVHGLLGENGAGKSTLIKILTGVYAATAGSIFVAGKEVSISSPLDARSHGISAVYQDAELVEDFSIAENMVLGDEPGRIIVSKRRVRAAARHLLDQIHIDMDVERKVSSLSAAERQLVVLARLTRRTYHVLVLDEPTARLSAEDTRKLLDLIKMFRQRGVAIIYISHILEEVKALCDRVTVLRGGMVSGVRSKELITEDEIVKLMIDDDASALTVTNPGLSTGVDLAMVSGLETDRLGGISFKLRKGEVLGVTGPVGSGMEDIGTVLAGLTRFRGDVVLDGKSVTLASPSEARRAGIALIPEDRRRQALFNGLTLGFNLALPVLRSLSLFTCVSGRRTRRYANQIIGGLNIRPDNPNIEVKAMSGGNQQKAVIGRWLKTGAKIYIFIQPTAGVDVGAISAIYGIILEMARGGAGVIVISSSAKEVLALSETVMVVQKGHVMLCKPRSDTTYDELLGLAME